jgi:hypothetical protein
MNPRTELKYPQLLLGSATITLIWFLLLDCYIFVGLVQSAGIFASATTNAFPFVLFVLFFFLAVMPFDLLYR